MASFSFEGADLAYLVFATFMIMAVITDVYCNILPGVRSLLASLSRFAIAGFKAFCKFESSLTRTWLDFTSFKFYIPWRSPNRVLVNKKEHLMQLSESSELSQRAAYSDMFGFKHTMNNLNVHDVINTRNRLFHRVLLLNGPPQFASLDPYLRKRLKSDVGEWQIHNTKDSSEWTSVRLASSIRKVSAGLMAVTFFGNNLSDDPVFFSSLCKYSRELVGCMAAFQIVPGFLIPFAHKLITSKGKAMHVLLSRLMPIMSSESKDQWDEPIACRKLTITHWMTELSQGSSYWTPSLLVQALLGIWFAASHQPWSLIHFSILELCSRPTYISQLRDEIGDFDLLDYETLQKLPLLDCFIKEIVRYKPLDTHSIRRKAVKPFTFSNGGPYVAEGQIACINMYDFVHNEATYPNPEQFNPFRFKTEAESKRSEFTEVSEKFPLWGYGSLACPGRYHASYVIKLTLAYLICNYDFKFKDEKARMRWSWETFTMPFESTEILFRSRQ